MDAKTCRECGNAKPLDAFPLQKGSRLGRHPLCKPCRADQESRRYVRDRDAILERARNDPKRKEAARGRQMLRKRGVTKQEYLDRFAEQGGACAICQRADVRLSADHDHVTGLFRGLLCDRCNLALGQFRDDVERLLTAAIYQEGA